MRHEPSTLTLFPDYAAPAAPLDRRGVIKRAFERASAQWRGSYESFILDYLSEYGPSIAETIRLAYEGRSDLVQLATGEKRASGAVFQKLLRQGKIKRVGYGQSKERCSPMPRYERAGE